MNPTKCNVTVNTKLYEAQIEIHYSMIASFEPCTVVTL